MSIDLTTYQRQFPSLQFASSDGQILEIVLANQGRHNAATETMHRDLALVWRQIDMDDQVRVVLVRGAGAHFSSGGDFDMIDRMIADEAVRRMISGIAAYFSR